MKTLCSNVGMDFFGYLAYMKPPIIWFPIRNHIQHLLNFFHSWRTVNCCSCSRA